MYPCIYGIDNPEYKMGNLIDQNLDVIWKSSKWNIFRGNLTLEDLTLEDSETSAVTPVSISRDDPAQPVTKVTFICRPLPISLITAATRKQSMS